MIVDGFSINGGVMARLAFVTVGVAAKDLAGKYVINVDGSEPVDMELLPSYRAGVAVRLPILGLVLAGDVELPPGDIFSNDLDAMVEDATIHVGAEAKLLFLKLRVGQSSYKNSPKLTTWGAGLQLGPLYGDLAAGQYEDSPELFDRVMVQLSFKF